MPVLEVEVKDDGSIGTLPEALQKFLDKRIDEAYKKGADKTEKALSPHLADPVEIEKLRQRAKQADEFELKDAERDKRYEEALKLREKAHAEETAAERKKTEAAVARVRGSISKSIRAAAATSGVRAESLDELERLLGAEVDLDETWVEFVKDAEGKPRVDDKGQRVTIEGLVADYLKTHPHHVAAASVKGGRAPGGATKSGHPPVPGDARSEARARVAEDPSTANVARLLRVATGAPSS